jgi:hypothetical protein
MLSQTELHERFEYRNGELFYKISPLPKIKVGSKAGGVNAEGYVRISVDGKKLSAHRIVFMMQHGYLPTEIDHINGNRTDNRIENLRAVNRTQNRYNIVGYKNNTSGVKGVVKNKNLDKWEVSLNVNGKRKYIGVFKDFELAELVAMEARHKYHGEYANNGIGA